MKTFTFLFSLLFLVHLNLSAQIYIGNTEVDTATVISGLDIPWEIQWGPDGQIWTTERYGRLSRINPETGEQDVVLDLTNQVYQSGESGLLGMVLHPDFENEPYVYMAYTYRPSGQILEKIVRYTYENGTLQNEYILLDNIPGNTTHDGCRMIILPDNTLLLTTGDAQNQPASQDIESLNGKLLRLNLDGSVPDDNPFPGNPVYSFGHRNAQGLYLAPNGIIYSSEHGPSTDDEFNIIEPGRNYGWPNVHGFCDLPSEQTFCEENDVYEPLSAWTPTVAASDIVYYDHPSIPDLKDHILMTTLKNKKVYDLELDASGTSVINEEHFFYNWWGRLRDILIGPNGEIYLATSGSSWSNTEPFTHEIVKIWNPEYVSIHDRIDKDNNTNRIFPNPAKEVLHISISQDLLGEQMIIYTNNGKMVLQQIVDSTSITVQLQTLEAGMYVLSIGENTDNRFSEKFFIIKD